MLKTNKRIFVYLEIWIVLIILLLVGIKQWYATKNTFYHHFNSKKKNFNIIEIIYIYSVYDAILKCV